MNSVVQQCENLTQEDVEVLEGLEGNLQILSDLSRADVLLYCLLGPAQAVVVSQSSPHSILPIYSESLIGRHLAASAAPTVLRALVEGRRGVTEVRRRDEHGRSPADGAPIVQEIFPIKTQDGRVIAALSIETNLIERERHRRRSKLFQRALTQLQHSAIAGSLRGVEALTSFAEHDGVLLLDPQQRIQYISGVATTLYRKLGYVGNLLKRRIDSLELDDSSIAYEALEGGQCLERESKTHGLVWVKKAIPVFSYRVGLRGVPTVGQQPRRLEGVLLTIRDETDSRRQDEELRVKSAMIQEIHHRVKNNMQTIASLLRLQSRRAESDDVRRALQEGISRILSVAVIHEFLAHQDARVINIRDVSQRIINQVREGILDREKGIRLDLRGPNIYLPTQPATVCALVINELLQNALEHGYDRQERGTVTVSLKDDGEEITISVDDDGAGLPDDFDLEQTSSLGLQIVRTLARGDLKGTFELYSRDNGVSAVVKFPKHSQGGGK